MFKFKLDSVLSLREKVEENKKRELGLAISYKDQLINEQQELIKKREETAQSVKVYNSQILDIQNIRAFNIYDAHMQKTIEYKSKQIQEAQKQVDHKRQALLEAVKERKILDNLKEIQKEVFIEEEKKKEQNILDDLVTYKYGRKERV